MSFIFAGESSPRPVFRWVENGKPRDANRTEVVQGVYVGGEKVTSIVEFRARFVQTMAKLLAMGSKMLFNEKAF